MKNAIPLYKNHETDETFLLCDVRVPKKFLDAEMLQAVHDKINRDITLAKREEAIKNKESKFKAREKTIKARELKLEQAVRALKVTIGAFVGIHLLTGVDREGGKGELNTFRFCMDGVVYKAEENPDDGYRSYLGELSVDLDNPIKNVFSPITVKGHLSNRGEVLELVDIVSGQCILRLGTDYSDDDYPVCINEWNPVEAKDGYSE